MAKFRGCYAAVSLGFGSALDVGLGRGREERGRLEGEREGRGEKRGGGLEGRGERGGDWREERDWRGGERERVKRGIGVEG